MVTSANTGAILKNPVSCLYGIGNPQDFHANVISLKVGEIVSRNVFLRKLVDSMYSRSEILFQRGNFRVKGDTVDIFPAYADEGIRIVFFGDEIEEICIFSR